jgi:hypothetical protein
MTVRYFSLLLACLIAKSSVTQAQIRQTPPGPLVVEKTANYTEFEFYVPVPNGPGGSTVYNQARINLPVNYTDGTVVLVASGSGPNDVEWLAGPPSHALFRMEQRAAEEMVNESVARARASGNPSEAIAFARMGKRGTYVPKDGNKPDKVVDMEVHGTNTLPARAADLERYVEYIEKSFNPYLVKNGYPKLNTQNLSIWGMSEGGAATILYAYADQFRSQPRIQRLSLQAPASASLYWSFTQQQTIWLARQLWDYLKVPHNQPITADMWPTTEEQWAATYPYPEDFMGARITDVWTHYKSLGIIGEKDIAPTFAHFSGGASKLYYNQFIRKLDKDAWAPEMDAVTEVIRHMKVPTTRQMQTWLKVSAQEFEIQMNKRIDEIPEDIYREQERKFLDGKDMESNSFRQNILWRVLGSTARKFGQYLTHAKTSVYHGWADYNVDPQASVEFQKLAARNPSIRFHFLSNSHHRDPVINKAAYTTAAFGEPSACEMSLEQSK